MSKPFFPTHLFVTTTLIFGSCFVLAGSVLADSTPPNTTISNTAVGTFEGTTSGTTGNVNSNIVNLTVLEVAGINAVPSGNQEAPAGVANAGPYQGIGGINTGDIVYFDFTVTNVGNDPTGFFIPGTAAISGGTLQNIQIIAVDPDGAGAAAATTVAVTVPAGVGGDTIALLGATNGYIPVNGTVKVRVVVKVTETIPGNLITATLGDTSTSAGSQNQPYSANGNADLYTNDLPNGTANPYPLLSFPSVSQVPEANGSPANGDAINHRQEASATQSVALVVSPVPKLLLVKRMTAINGVNITGFVDDPSTTDDNDPNWPNPTTYLRGAINGVKVAPGDRLEYTIYFLSVGNTPVTNITICDLIPPQTTFVTNAYDVVGGGSNLGIALANSSVSLPINPTVYLTGLFDSDRASLYPVGSTPPSTCKKPNTNTTLTPSDNTDGLVVVDVVKSPTQLPFATGVGTPSDAYGFVRFQVRVR